MLNKKFESLNDKFESFRTEIKEELKSFLNLLASKGGVASGKGIVTELSLHSGATGSASSQSRSDNVGDMVTPARTYHEDRFFPRPYKLECPRFSGDDFKSWMLKLEQYMEAENVPEASKVRTVMLHLEGRALQWHHYYAKLQGGTDQLNWV